MATDDRFQEAVARAKSAVSPNDWLNLAPSEQAAAIYRELRELDLQAAPLSNRLPGAQLDESLDKANTSVRINECRVARQAERVTELEQTKQAHASEAAKTLLAALEARLELARRRLRLLMDSASK